MTIKAMSGYSQIWDVFMWLTTDYRHLITQAPLCLEQKKVIVNQTKLIVVGIKDGYHWNCVAILSHSKIVIGLALTGLSTKYLLGIPKLDTVVV